MTVVRKTLEWIGGRLHDARISLRLSILSVVLLLVLSTAAAILWFVTDASYNNAIESAKRLISISSDKIVHQLNLYFLPLNEIPLTISRLVDNGMLELGENRRNDEQLLEFMRSTVAVNKNIAGMYYADEFGSFYLVNRLDDNSYYQLSVNRNEQVGPVYATQSWLDPAGHFISKDVPIPDPVDPRSRVWYQYAHKRGADHQGVSWIRYRFGNYGRRSHTRDGVTSVLPLKDGKGRVYGVVCVDILSDQVEKYLSSLGLQDGSVALIYDDSDSILWRFVFGNSKIKDSEVYSMPAVYSLLSNDGSDHNNILTFRAGSGPEHIASVRRLDYVRDELSWFVAIIVSVDSLVRDVELNFVRALLLAVSATLLGVLGAIRFAGSISRPINQLADDSDYMCDLQFDKVLYRPSIIKELDDMSRSFINMRNALFSFKRYMPVDVVRQLVASGQVANVGGERRVLTVMFSDIRSFTDLAEGLVPEELMQYLSTYLQCISSVIVKNYGTIDKYIGDSVMCFWGAPTADQQHAIHACQTILDAKKALRGLQDSWRAQGKPVIVTRFGVNTGAVVVGNVGSDERLDYTALGDAVNLASRLEGINKMYGTTVAVGESTYQLAKEQFRFRRIDLIRVKGKFKATYLYELLDDNHWLWNRVEEYNLEFAQAFDAYQNGDWQKALEAFEILLSHYPEDNLSVIFVERCVKFIEKPPVVWDGVWEYRVK